MVKFAYGEMGAMTRACLCGSHARQRRKLLTEGGDYQEWMKVEEVAAMLRRREKKMDEGGEVGEDNQFLAKLRGVYLK